MDPDTLISSIATVLAGGIGGAVVSWFRRRKTRAEARLLEAKADHVASHVAKEWIDGLQLRIRELEAEVHSLKDIISRQRAEIADLVMSLRRVREAP